MTLTAWWTVVILAGGLAGTLAALYYQEGQILRLGRRDDAIINELSIARRSNQHLAARIAALEVRDDTGPINVLDRPTLAQLAAPTRPDMAARPEIRTGATASGRGAHRAR